MDSDGVYRRVNINKVIAEIQKNNSDISESKAQELALLMIKELNKRVADIVKEFESGEGYFMSCYYDTYDSIN